MRKSVVILLMIGLVILGVQVAFAADAGAGGRGNPCFLDLLPKDARLQAESILNEFHDQMAVLREQVASFRGADGRESRSEVHNEMWELKREAREQIASLLPDEHQEKFMNRDYGRHRHFQPENRPLRGGWKAGNSSN